MDQVFSWEPLRCHDVVDVGWSKIADLNINDGKLLGCSYNKSCVGIWVVDLSVSVGHLKVPKISRVIDQMSIVDIAVHKAVCSW